MKNKELFDARSKTVIKSNEIIQRSRFNLSLLEQKIILYLISQINPWDEDFKLYSFSIAEFSKVCGFQSDSGGNYAYLKETIKSLRDKSIWVKIDEDTETLLSWISKAVLHEKSGTIQIRLDEDMKPYLLQLKRNYTSYELIWTLCMKSKYSVRMYELINSIHYHDIKEYRRKYSVDEMKRLLGGEHYKEYRDFKRKALEPSVREINLYTDKSISYQEIKKGRKTLAIELVITSKEPLKMLEARELINQELGPEQLSFFDSLER